MWELLKNLVSGAAALFRYKEKRLDLDNSAEMQANAEAKRDRQIIDEINQNIAKRDAEAVRRKLAE